MRFGVHVNRTGGLMNALEAARDLGCDTIQIFSRSPRSLRPGSTSEEEASKFRQGLAALGIRPLVIHAPYLLNLASPKEEIYGLSVDALTHDISLARAVGADYLAFHPGSHLGSGEEDGIRRIAGAILKACEETDLSEGSGPMLLLEMVSGAGTGIGWTFEQQKAIIDRVQGAPIGVCLDTCHMFASGYDVATREGLERTLNALDEAIGLSRAKVVHANDSVGGLGSRLDRHAHIGEGQIGEMGFQAILGCTRLDFLPFILETPRKSPGDDARNLAAIRRIAAEAVKW